MTEAVVSRKPFEAFPEDHKKAVNEFVGRVSKIRTIREISAASIDDDLLINVDLPHNQSNLDRVLDTEYFMERNKGNINFIFTETDGPEEKLIELDHAVRKGAEYIKVYPPEEPQKDQK